MKRLFLLFILIAGGLQVADYAQHLVTAAAMERHERISNI